MKILLIEPAKAPLTLGAEDVFMFEPLALEYVAAGVPDGHDVMILDMRLEKRLKAVLDSFAPDVVGITAYTVHVNTVKGLFEQVKKWNPKVLTVVGGHHATVFPHDFVSPFIDLIVQGEGVAAFREIVERREQGAGFDGIPGVALPANGGLKLPSSMPVEDLNAAPLPARKLTAKYRKRYFSEWMRPLASIRTSKGCPHRCNFCALWKIAGGRYLKRDPASIVEELGAIDEKYVFFADDESLLDVPRMKQLAHMIKDAGIKKRYFLYGRSDTIARNRDLLAAWKEIGLERVFVGLEFFRDEDLGYVNKGSTTQDNEKAVHILQSLGLEIYASLIVRPEYSREDFKALRDYCRRLRLSFATFTVLTPLPGTDLYEDVKGNLLTHNYDLFDFMHTVLPTALPLREFCQEYSRLFTEAIPTSKQFAMLGKYPVSQMVPTILMSRRINQRLKAAYKDYD